MRLFSTFILLTICLTATGQTFLKKKDSRFRVDTLFTKKYNTQKRLTHYPYTYIDTEYKYTDSTGIVVIVQNSSRKGGKYTDPTGKDFFSGIYWYRIINETSIPLELTINFPADSFATLPSPDSYIRVFLPLDTMTLDKEILYAYGATGLESSLDTGLNKPTMLQRTINPKAACLFYIGAPYYQASAPARAELVLKEQDVFYRIGGIEIPCGQIVFKN